MIGKNIVELRKKGDIHYLNYQNSQIYLSHI